MHIRDEKEGRKKERYIIFDQDTKVSNLVRSLGGGINN